MKNYKNKLLSEPVKTILRNDIDLRITIADQLGITQKTVYDYAVKPNRSVALAKYPFVVDILKKKTGLGKKQILIDKSQ